MKDVLHPLSADISEEFEGGWRPAIPYPWFTMHWLFWYRARCVCGRKFKNLEEYKTHYRAANEEEAYYNNKLERASVRGRN